MVEQLRVQQIFVGPAYCKTCRLQAPYPQAARALAAAIVTVAVLALSAFAVFHRGSGRTIVVDTCVGNDKANTTTITFITKKTKP